jgi:hypothetical protein
MLYVKFKCTGGWERWQHESVYCPNSQHHSPALVECYMSHFSICNAFGLHIIFVCFFSTYVSDPWPIVQMMQIIQVFMAVDKVFVKFKVSAVCSDYKNMLPPS